MWLVTKRMAASDGIELAQSFWVIVVCAGNPQIPRFPDLVTHPTPQHNPPQQQMMLLTFLTVLAVLASAVANYVRMEPSVQTFASSKWLKESALGDDEVIRAVFVLKHDRAALQQFEQNLLDISTPSSARYGQWLKVSDLFLCALITRSPHASSTRTSSLASLHLRRR